jgi:FtsH-binding integral membrane protein
VQNGRQRQKITTLTYTHFGKHLLGIAAVTGLLNLSVPLFVTYATFAWGSWFIFMNISIVLFVLSKMTVNSVQKSLFTGVFMGGTLLKLLSSLAFLLWYQTTSQPVTKWFIAPFLLYFLVFTVFETYFLERIAKAK